MILYVPQLPDVTIDSVEASARDVDTVAALEEAIAGWSAALAAVMQRESEKRPAGKGPLAEVEFWRSRSAVLSGLFEQLGLPHVVRMIATAEAGSDDRNLLTAFRSQLSELTKLATEVGGGGTADATWQLSWLC